MSFQCSKEAYFFENKRFNCEVYFLLKMSYCFTSNNICYRNMVLSITSLYLHHAKFDLNDALYQQHSVVLYPIV